MNEAIKLMMSFERLPDSTKKRFIYDELGKSVFNDTLLEKSNVFPEYNL